MQGFLFLRSETDDSWRKAWAIVDKGVLAIFALTADKLPSSAVQEAVARSNAPVEEMSSSQEPPLRRFRLRGAKTSVEESHQKLYPFLVTSKTTSDVVLLASSSSDDREKWVNGT